MRPSVLLISETTLKARTVISDNIDPKILKQTIEVVQEEKIHPALGTALYNRLLEAVEDNTLNADETTLLNDYVTNVMKWYVLAELPMAIGVKFYNRNILRKGGEGDENLSMTELYDVMNYYKNKGEFQEQRMIKYLQQNADSTTFSEYINPGTDIDTIHPKKRGYTCPIVLDDRESDGRTNGYDFNDNSL